jgi:thiamine-monophosphate kinase
MVEDVHFRRSLSSLADVGWKVVTVNVSDLAAMGASPTVAVVGLAKPAAVSAEETEELYRGMDEACRRYGLRLVGGDTVAADALALSVTVLGDVAPDAAVRRSGAKPGDRIVVVGTLGAAAAALAQVDAGVEADPVLLEAHRRPVAQVEAGKLLAAQGATAMIDVSDGFGADLGHIAAASGVGALVEAGDLPVAPGVAAAAEGLGVDPLDFVTGGGDDYALVATFPADLAGEAALTAGGVVVGSVTADPRLLLRLDDGTEEDLSGRGWQHFREGKAS